MKSFAILIVCYKRINGIKRLINSLERVDFNSRKDITLIFSIDYSGDTEVIDFAKKYIWPFGDKIIKAYKERQGLKKHILQCGDFTNNFDILVVLEDDVYVSNSLYNFAYNAAEFYFEDDNIAGISLYSYQKNWLNWPLRFEPQKSSYDCYFLKIAQSWGQVWTKKKWDEFKNWLSNHSTFEQSGTLPDYLYSWPESSWLKYHIWYCIENNKFFVYPYFGVSTNYSDAGEHSKATITDHQIELQFDKHIFSFPIFEEDSIKYDEYCNRITIFPSLQNYSQDLTVDFWQTKDHKIWKRYLLTTRCLNFKILDSFSLSLRPIEMSVLEDLKGNGIYLYDTMTRHNNRFGKDDKFSLLSYSLRTGDYKVLLKYSLHSFFSKVKKKVFKK